MHTAPNTSVPQPNVQIVRVSCMKGALSSRLPLLQYFAAPITGYGRTYSTDDCLPDAGHAKHRVGEHIV